MQLQGASMFQQDRKRFSTAHKNVATKWFVGRGTEGHDDAGGDANLGKK